MRRRSTISIETKSRNHLGAGRPAAAEATTRTRYLLDTAAEVFLEQGFRNTKIDEIVRRAGASKSTLYARYPTKAELFVAVITRKTQQVQESFAEALVPGATLAHALEEFGSRALRAIARPEQRALFRVFVASSPRFPDLASRFWDKGPERSIRMLADYLAHHPEFRGTDPVHAAEMFWSLCCGFSLLKSQLQKDFVVPESVIEGNIRDAVHFFLAVYGSMPGSSVLH